jgi:hypothetical protein
MNTLIKGLSSAEQEEFFKTLQIQIDKGEFNPLPVYQSAARRENARRASTRMIGCITGTSLAVALLGAFIGFEIAVVAGLIYLTQRFLDERQTAQTLNNTIATGGDITLYLDAGDRQDYQQILKLQTPYEDLEPSQPIDAEWEIVIVDPTQTPQDHQPADSPQNEVIEDVMDEDDFDDLETTLMIYFLRRKGQKKTAREISRAGLKGLPVGTKQSDIETYLLLLQAEGKLHRDGNFFYY